jgi:hypothetical protein
MEAPLSPVIRLITLKEGHYYIQFLLNTELIFAAEFCLDIESEFYNDENFETFYNYIPELLLNKTINSENCYYALNKALCDLPHSLSIEVTFGYQSTLLNRYSEN